MILNVGIWASEGLTVDDLQTSCPGAANAKPSLPWVAGWWQEMIFHLTKPQKMLRIGHPHPPTTYHETNSRILRPLQMGVSHPLGLWQTSRPGKKKIEASHRYKLTSLTSLNATVHQTVLFESSLHSLKFMSQVLSTLLGAEASHQNMV